MATPTLHDLTRWIRDYVGDPRHQPRLMADEFSWHQLCAAMDIIEDTDSAVDAYVGHDFPNDTGEKYLRIYGILQGLYLQQDALVDLIDAIRPVRGINPTDVLTDGLNRVRGARNVSIGHPTRHGRKPPFSTHAIIQMSMRKEGFSLSSYPKKNSKPFQDIAVLKLIAKQRAETTRILLAVVEDLRERDENHRAQFREVKLMQAFDHVSYAFENIFEELAGNSPGAMGKWGVDHLRKSLADLEKELQTRGLSIESYSSIQYLYRDEIEYPLTELRKFLYREPSDIPSSRSASVYTDALRPYFDQLREIAREIDEEYASEPEPVVRP
jgi:hypothetical protein